MKNCYLIFLAVFTISTLGSCRKLKEDPFESLINVQDIAAGTTCSTGGILIQTGIDKNRNKILDADEVQNSKPVCNGTNGTNGANGSTDKITILPILRSDFDFYSCSQTTPFKPYGSLLKFSKTNYPGVDSITLITNAWTQTQGGSAIVQLYNLTDNISIAGTSVISTNYSSGWDQTNLYTESKNLYSLLPNKEINLAMTIASGTDGQVSVVSRAYLILYRK